VSERFTTKTLSARAKEPTSGTDTFTEELLIKEAQRRARQRRARGVVATLVLLGMVLGVSWAVGGGSRTKTPHQLRSGDGPRAIPLLDGEVTNTSLGAGTEVNAVDMLSSSLGYSVISNDPFHPHGAVYIAATTNGGDKWNFRGELPFTTYSAGTNEAIPSVHFVNRSIGYVVGVSLPDPLFVTTNGGRSWERVHSPGVAPSLAFQGSTMAEVSQICQGSLHLNRCRGELSLYRVGRTVPLRSSSITPLAHVTVQDPRPLALLSPTSLVVMEGPTGGGGQAGSTAMLTTSNGGATWQSMSDPCPTLGYGDQLLTPTPHRWILSCFLGEGMMSGESSLWLSTNGGASWSIINRNNDSSSTKGTIGTGGGVDMTIAISGDHRVLFGAIGGAQGGLQVSTDGGAHWTSAHLDVLGGSPQTLSTFGPRGAVDDVVAGLIYRTTNARTWAALPPLPAGTYRGDAICTARAVTAALGVTHVKGIPGAYPLVFTNHSPRPCYLDGPPVVQPVTGANQPVGPLAYRNVNFQPDFVVVSANGGTASTTLAIDSGWPRAQCAPRRVSSVIVRFNLPSSFTVSLPNALSEVCARLPSVMVNQIIAGPGAIATG